MRTISGVFFICLMLAFSGVRADDVDLEAVARDLSEFDALPAADRAAYRELAVELVQPWFPQYQLGGTYKKRTVPGALMQGIYGHMARYAGVSNEDVVPQLQLDLEAAIDLDPTLVEVWLALSMVESFHGHQRSRNHLLQAARLAAAGSAVRPRAPKPLREGLHAHLAVNFRQLGNWEAGLAETDTLMQLAPDNNLYLAIKGLLLAGQGAYSEAMSLAIRMDGISFPRRTPWGRGNKSVPHNYANNWIKSQALLSVGDYHAARHALGHLERPLPPWMPLARYFWNDAGLILELCDDPQAVSCYLRARNFIFLHPLLPVRQETLSRVVLNLPAPDTPLWTVDGREYLAGSPFSYLASQLNLMATTTDSTEQDAARDRALDMVDNLQARGVRKDICQAFRGRILMADGQVLAAYGDLSGAYEGFKARNLFDPGTTLLLGQLHLLRREPDLALALFRDLLDHAPNKALAWRELGIACSQAGDPNAAVEAMGTALDLEPNSTAGWFNMGVLLYRLERHAEALESLEKAWELDQDNQKIINMLQRVSLALRD